MWLSSIDKVIVFSVIPVRPSKGYVHSRPVCTTPYCPYWWKSYASQEMKWKKIVEHYWNIEWKKISSKEFFQDQPPRQGWMSTIIIITLASTNSKSKITESIQGSSLSLQSIDNIQSSHRLSIRMHWIRHGVMDHFFQKGFQNTTGFLVDQARDSFDSSSSSQSSDGWFSNSFFFKKNK